MFTYLLITYCPGNYLPAGADHVEYGWLSAILVLVIVSVLAQKAFKRIHSAPAPTRLAADKHLSECSSTSIY